MPPSGRPRHAMGRNMPRETDKGCSRSVGTRSRKISRPQAIISRLCDPRGTGAAASNPPRRRRREGATARPCVPIRRKSREQAYFRIGGPIENINGGPRRACLDPDQCRLEPVMRMNFNAEAVEIIGDRQGRRPEGEGSPMSFREAAGQACRIAGFAARSSVLGGGMIRLSAILFFLAALALGQSGAAPAHARGPASDFTVAALTGTPGQGSGHGGVADLQTTLHACCHSCSQTFAAEAGHFSCQGSDGSHQAALPANDSSLRQIILARDPPIPRPLT